MLKSWRANIWLCISLAVLGVVAEEIFDEELLIRPLRDGKVVSRFSFTTLLKDSYPRSPEALGTDDQSQHYTVFPLALGQILREHAITEFHLTLNAGKWDYDRWGYSDEQGVGSGAELWAWMGEGAPVSVDDRWRGLRNSLAGLFCASLGSLDEQRTTSPVFTFTPEGSLPDWKFPHQLRHASLPSEHVCTENLTPFLKLLPCKASSGVASLLNPLRIFDADWHGMGVHVLWTEEGVQVRLTFQAVSDPIRISDGHKRDWSFRSLFDRTIKKSCPVAHTSNIKIVLPRGEAYALNPDPTTVNNTIAVYNVASYSDPIDVGIRWPLESIFKYPLDTHEKPLTDLSIRRTLQGSSQDHGELHIVIRNNIERAVSVAYLETMPWLLQFYLHTMRIQLNGIPRDDLISNISYTPAIPHSQPTMLQSVLIIPAKATVHLTIDVTKSFLRYTEHPPDAQRGWDLPPAVFTQLDVSGDRTTDFRLDNTSLIHSRRMYTPALLVDLATPDFSMPYNVIIMSCSLMAMIFGSIFNLLTRIFVIVDLRRREQGVR